MRFRFITALAATAATAALVAPALSANAASPTTSSDDYVALGDSYTAGPFIPVQTPGPLGCFRSTADYPSFLAAYLDVKTFTDVSCSAARSEHLYEPQTANLPDGLPENENAPQLLAVSETTDLVTLGIGGNDYSLFGEMIDNCARLAKEQPKAVAPCKDYFTENGVDTKMRDARRIQANIEKAVQAIQAKAPNAKVVVVGYLHILPENVNESTGEGTCKDIPFAPGDYNWGTEVEKTLNHSIETAAEKFGATYIDMYGASVGHDACAADEPWVNGSQIKPNAFNYHPFRIGMENIAKTTYEKLAGQAAVEALPEMQVLKRAPSLLDTDALLEYVKGGGALPPGTLPPGAELPGSPVAVPEAPSETPGTAAAGNNEGDNPDAAAVDATNDKDGTNSTRATQTANANSSSGLMPDTGGPTLLLILIGLGLVGLGTMALNRGKS